MRAKRVRRLRIIDSMLHRASRRQGQPRAIDRYIDYFGDRAPRRPRGGVVRLRISHLVG